VEFWTELPRTAVGKIQKKEIRAKLGKTLAVGAVELYSEGR